MAAILLLDAVVLWLRMNYLSGYRTPWVHGHLSGNSVDVPVRLELLDAPPESLSTGAMLQIIDSSLSVT